jgi:hypothetical protein
MEKYLGCWACKEDVERDFNLSEGELKNVKIIVACYEQPSYEGYAFVLFKQGRKYYEVNGSHCSCYGLEGQWTPEETSLEEIRHRVEKGDLGHYMDGGEKDVLAAMEGL